MILIMQMIKICTMLMIVLIIISCLFLNTFLHAQEDTPATVSSQEELPNEIIKRTPKIEMYRCDECHDSEESFNSKIRPMAKDKDQNENMIHGRVPPLSAGAEDGAVFGRDPERAEGDSFACGQRRPSAGVHRYDRGALRESAQPGSEAAVPGHKRRRRHTAARAERIPRPEAARRRDR